MKEKEFKVRIVHHQFDDDEVTASAIERAILAQLIDVPAVIEIAELKNKEF